MLCRTKCYTAQFFDKQTIGHALDGRFCYLVRYGLVWFGIVLGLGVITGLSWYILHKLRELKEYQKQVAQKLGVIQPYISRIENGYENMSLEILEKISRVLKAHVSVKLQ